jgi:hypothetical protein
VPGEACGTTTVGECDELAGDEAVEEQDDDGECPWWRRAATIVLRLQDVSSGDACDRDLWRVIGGPCGDVGERGSGDLSGIGWGSSSYRVD